MTNDLQKLVSEGPDATLRALNPELSKRLADLEKQIRCVAQQDETRAAFLEAVLWVLLTAVQNRAPQNSRWRH